MSNIDELIQKFCPDKIPYCELAAVCKDCTKEAITQKDISAAGTYPVINSSRNVLGFVEKYNNSTDTIVLTSHGAYAGFCHYMDVPFFAGALCYPMKSNSDKVLTKYLYYIFKSIEPLIREKYVNKSGVPYINAKALMSYKIPIPPLPVQEEIVRILDKLTELETELEEELEKELEARRKQYEWYRDRLLDNCANAVDMEFGDLFDLKNGFAFKSNLFRNAGSPILRITNIQANSITIDSLVCIDTADYKENLSEYAVNPGDIVIAMSGATTGKIGANKTNQTFFLNQRVGKFIPKENVVLNRFLYHLLLRKYQEIYAISCGGAQPNLSSEKLKRIRAKIPPLEEQQYIVTTLDHLDALCNDITTGLPAEIAARRKQYEYYRNKLLSFEEVA